MNELESRFQDALIGLYTRTKKELHYNAKRFMQMLLEDGAVATAKKLIRKEMSDGLTELWVRHRLDLSVEAAVINPRWNDLFTDEDRQISRDKLVKLGYKGI